MEPVGFIQESNMFVVTEGEAARCLNFNSGSFFTHNIFNSNKYKKELEIYTTYAIQFEMKYFFKHLILVLMLFKITTLL